MTKSMLAILLMALLATATLQQNRPVPVGVRQGEEAVQQGQSSVPPPLYRATPDWYAVACLLVDLALAAYVAARVPAYREAWHIAKKD